MGTILSCWPELDRGLPPWWRLHLLQAETPCSSLFHRWLLTLLPSSPRATMSIALLPCASQAAGNVLANGWNVLELEREVLELLPTFLAAPRPCVSFFKLAGLASTSCLLLFALMLAGRMNPVNHHAALHIFLPASIVHLPK
ncbi:hypothetical protein VIGAN_07246100 [Vigna angularis var. angularis]|uniref:Uncharacterized protein n=1 Tax=Vigna angularis var. angularis TaxID=157739 RepID=A0A0S3SL22_PHAAN|nr:hypothetical protein VIGAN_07246100 [Vigna angularis var. angularis]